MVFEQETNTGAGNNNMHIFLIIYILFILIFSVVGVILLLNLFIADHIKL